MKFGNTTLLSCVLLLSACGGGGDSSSTVTISAKATGYWEGLYTTTTNLIFPAVALVASSGEIGIKIENGITVTGLYEVDGNNITMLGGESVSKGSLLLMGGSVAEENSLSLAAINNSQMVSEGDSFALAYNSLYERNTTLATVEGSWSGSNNVDSVIVNVNLVITADGQLTGDIDGSPLTGVVSDTNEQNEYSIDMSVTNPNNPNGFFVGEYEGISMLRDTNLTNDTLLVFIERFSPNLNRSALILTRN